LRHRIVHLLSACAGRRECGLAVLRTGEQIDSYVVWNRQVSLPVRAGVNERCGTTAAPILGRTRISRTSQGRIAKAMPAFCIRILAAGEALCGGDSPVGWLRR